MLLNWRRDWWIDYC